jgi:hypothetical protein
LRNIQEPFRGKILVSDNIAEEGIAVLRQEAHVDVKLKMKLKNALSCSLLYTYMKDKALKDLSPDDIEKRCNDMIFSTLPPRLDEHSQKVAIDLVLIPYYGDEETEDIRRSQAKKARPNSSAMPVHT